jgi:hypothetical protein
MFIRIRESDKTDSLADYRAAQTRAWVQRNQKRLRDEFWERKRLDHEAGQRWLAEHAPEELAATVAAR